MAEDKPLLRLVQPGEAPETPVAPPEPPVQETPRETPPAPRPPSTWRLDLERRLALVTDPLRVAVSAEALAAGAHEVGGRMSAEAVRAWARDHLLKIDRAKLAGEILEPCPLDLKECCLAAADEVDDACGETIAASLYAAADRILKAPEPAPHRAPHPRYTDGITALDHMGFRPLFHKETTP